MTQRVCCTLSLKDDPALIEKYEWHHRAENSWPEIVRSILGAGILEMEIYRTDTTLFMIMEVDDTFDPALKAETDQANHRVQEWETLMETFQDVSRNGEGVQKWQLVPCIYRLSDAAMFHEAG